MVNHLISLELLKELDSKRLYIKRNHIDPEEIEHKFILREARQHSARIEKPKALLYNPDADEEAKEMRKRDFIYYEDNLEQAWEYGILNISLPLGEEDIRRIAFLIDPAYFEQRYNSDNEVFRLQLAPFRGLTEGVRVSGSLYTPPYPAKLPREMQRLIKDMAEMGKLVKEGEVHPVEIAAYCHFQLARIHPFSDANGRTSRMLQDIILRKHNFPAAAFFEGERRFYYKLLEDAERGYRQRDPKNKDFLKASGEEERFFGFVGAKVNNSLDKILDKHFVSVLQ